MSKEDTFLLLDLKDIKSKEVAQSISNDTSRQILDYINQKDEAKEAELAKKLNIPISTIHYNLAQLKKAGLLTTKEFEWSEKGKKVLIYTLAKKLIIIAPKSTHGFKEKLKSILPTVFIGTLAAGFIYQLTKVRTSFKEIVTITVTEPAKSVIADTAVKGAGIAAESEGVSGLASEVADEVAQPAADLFVAQSGTIITETSKVVSKSFIPTFTQQPAFYFILGFLTLALILFLIKKFRTN